MPQKAPAYIPARLPSLPCLRNTAGVPWKQLTELSARERGEGRGIAPGIPQEQDGDAAPELNPHCPSHSWAGYDMVQKAI